MVIIYLKHLKTRPRQLNIGFLFLTYLILNLANVANAQQLQPAAGKLNFYSCTTGVTQEIYRVFVEDQQEILNEAIQENQCELITNIKFATAEEFLISEDTQEVLQSINTATVTQDGIELKQCDDEETCSQFANNKNVQMTAFQITEFHLNPEQFSFLLQLAKDYREQPTATVLVFFFSSDAKATVLQGNEGENTFHHYDIKKAALFVERKNGVIQYDPSNK